MRICDLQKRAHATSRAKGWWDGVEGKPSPQCVVEKLCLVHTEVTETEEEWRLGNFKVSFAANDRKPHPKPIGLPIELADVTIRTADLAEAMGIDLGGETTIADLQYASRREQRGIAPLLPAVRVLSIHAPISNAVEAVRDGREPNLGHVLRWVAMVAESFYLDLTEAIEIKMAYNETRPHRHGKVL